VDMISAEVKRLRLVGQLPFSLAPTSETRLDEAGLGLDSLERLHLAAAFSESLHLHKSGLEDHLLARLTIGEWCEVASESLRRFSAILTFRTSGSAGIPKSCAHPLLGLEQEVDVLLGTLYSGQRVLSAVPSHHIYGFLLTMLLPSRLGNVPVIDVRSHSPGAVVALARPDDIVVGHPAFWDAVVRAVPSGWPARVTGVTSTAPCAAVTAAGLRVAGLSRLLQIHGSSETAGLGWRDDPNGPYTLLPYWQRSGGEELLRASVSDDGVKTLVALPDRMEWLDERRYYVNGRIDGAVQVGGVNVFPNRVSAVLSKHSGVAAISVRLMLPSEGLRLKAFIVAEDSAGDLAFLRRGLDALAAEQLSAPERPRAYTFGSALPADSMGKLIDW
jgi:long-chain acyl-CoA synthetase